MTIALPFHLVSPPLPPPPKNVKLRIKYIQRNISLNLPYVGKQFCLLDLRLICINNKNNNVEFTFNNCN